ncbi:uncharacterized protein IAS62_001855 [Cryptococcus decagattii]|uniref:Velvet domain-containing protein n=1 Tax=Cryptococcus decagattii TaxID=1859122 RepID=A0ABZ2APW1_9TREE
MPKKARLLRNDAPQAGAKSNQAWSATVIINLASLRFCFISQLGFDSKLHAAFVCIARFNQPIFCRSLPPCLFTNPCMLGHAKNRIQIYHRHAVLHYYIKSSFLFTACTSTKKRKRMDQTSGHPLPTNLELSADTLNLASKAGQERWTYHLEILQEPLRARACGFGNKVDPNTVDSNTLVLQIDLCSADGHEGRNVVRHPAGPGNAPAAVSMGENARSGHVDSSTLPPITTAVSDQPYEDTSTDHSSWSKQYPLGSSDRTTPGWTYQDNFVSSSRVAGTRPLIARQVRTPTRPSTAPSSHPPAWSLDVSGRPLYEEVLPPISALAEDLRHSSGHSWFPDPHNNMQRPTSSSSLRSRPHTSHSTDLSTAPTDYSIGRPTTTSSTTSWHLPLNSEYKGFAHGSQAAEDSETDSGGGPDDSKVPTSSAETQTTSPRAFLPGNPLYRTSLFFFATDLGIRTEGRFCLRMKIMDLSLFLRAPNPGDSVPILAETVSQPIEVYSAKRFPGVIPTTKLTRLFAAQGIKLAVRENHKQKYRNKESVDMDVQDGIDEDEDGQ